MKSKIFKRIYACFMSILMVLSVVQGTGLTVFADDEVPQETTQEVVDETQEIEEVEQTAEPQVEEVVEVVAEQPVEEVVVETQTEEVVQATATPETQEVVESTEVTEVQATAESVGAPQVEETTEEEIVLEDVEETFVTLLAGTESEGETDPQEVVTELSSYVTSLTLMQNGTVIESGTSVNVGDVIKLVMEYKIPGEVFAGSRTYSYTLPVNVEYEDQTGNIMQGNNIVGHYSVINNVVQFFFKSADSYNPNNDITVNTFEISGTAKYVQDASDSEKEFLYQSGSKTIVVTNPGDFTITKTAAKVYQTIAKTNQIAYTVTINSTTGTSDVFTVTDRLNIWGGQVADARFVGDSFVVLDADQNTVTSYTLTISENGRTYTMTNLPKLDAGKSYTISYLVNVDAPEGFKYTSTNGSVQNKVTVSSNGVTKTANKEVGYTPFFRKQYGGYNMNRGMKWVISGSINGTNLAGTTITDTPSTAIANVTDVSDLLVVRLKNSSGTYTNIGDVTVTNNTITFTFPDNVDYSKYVSWELAYYTVGVDNVTNVTDSNTAIIKTPDGGEWNSGEIKGIGYKTTTKVDKTLLTTSDDYKVRTWSFTADYTGLENKDINYVSVTDGMTTNYWNNLVGSSGGYTATGNMYSLLSELDEELKNNETGISITETKNGVAKTMTYAEAIAAGYTIEITYRSANSDSSNYNVTDPDAKVRWFQIKVTSPEENLYVTNISVKKYTTRFIDTALEGNIFQIANQISSNYIYDTEKDQFALTNGGLSKLVHFISGSGENATKKWSESSAEMDYDDFDGNVEYLIVAQIAADQDSITITDKLPDGLKLSNVDSTGELAPVAVYALASNVFDFELWSEENRAENVSVTYDEQTNTVTVKLTGLGSALPLLKSRLVGIQLFCEMPENLSSLEGSTVTRTEDGAITSHTFTNTATSDTGLEATASITVNQESKLLDKTGAQSSENNSIVDYSIEINPFGLDLMEGSDVLTLTDVIQSEELSVSLLRDTIKLYYMNEDGSKGDEASINALHINYPEENEDGSVSQTFEMVINDETAYIVEYSYQVGPINASSTGSGSLENKAILNGIISTEDSTKIVAASSSATSDHASLNLYKVDANNSATYLSATFKLEKYENGSYTTVIDAFDVSGKTGKTFDYNDANSVLEVNTLYRIIETDAPEGYRLDETPFYFVIRGTSDTEESAKEKAGVTDENVQVLEPNKGSYFDLANTKVTSVTVTKTWDDSDNQDGVRPESITVVLVKNDVPTDTTVTLNDENNWTATFEDLDEKENGQVISYTVEEVAVDQYTATITGNQETGYTIKNTHETEKTEVSGTKTWVDNDNQDGKRPESITVNLLADNERVDSKTVTVDDNWTYSFTNLPKYKGGVEITYTVTENTVEDYSTSYDGYNITNSYTPGKTSVTVTKTWNDNGNQDGLRASYGITLTGKVGDTVVYTSEEVTLDAATLTYTFNNLAKYSNGQEIVYTVEETNVPVGYTASVDGYAITNAHTPDTTSVTVTKTWNDNDNQDGLRASYGITLTGKVGDTVVYSSEEVTLDAATLTYTFNNLAKYSGGQEIVYTVEETTVPAGYTASYDGNNITNSYTPGKTSVNVTKTWDDNDNQDGIRPESITVILVKNGADTENTVTLSAENNWTATFENLEEKENGQAITYTVKEVAVEGYESVIDGNASTGFTIKNTHITETTDVTGTKTWNDENNLEGFRPESITVTLTGTVNEETVYEDSKTVTEADGWTYSFTDLAKYYNGTEITYTVSEGAVENYTTSYDGYNIINTHEVSRITVSGTKTWVDGDNQDGKRPERITVNLIATVNEETVSSLSQSIVVSANENGEWTYSFENLQKFYNGTEIAYSITENAVDGYVTTVDGTNLVNTHETDKTEITVTKTWNDNNNQDGLRPSKVTVQLTGSVDGNAVAVYTQDITEADGWTYTFTDLPVYNNGQVITYTVEEINVDENYSAEVNGYEVVNTHTPLVMSREVSKVWDDSDDQDGIRPESITVRLTGKVQETEVYTKEVELTAAEGWTYKFENLDVNYEGQAIVYTVEEVGEVTGYTSTVEGFTITNTHKTEETEITVTKTWVDDNDKDQIRPDAITVTLTGTVDGKGVSLKTFEVTASDNWTYTLTGLDKYYEGTEIVYTIEEKAVSGYTTEIKGYDITNTHEPTKTTEKTPGTPKTGVDTSIGGYLASLIASLGLFLGLLLVLKRH